MLLDVFSDYIAFQIYRVSGFAFTEIRVRVGVRDDGDFSDAIFPRSDGQADAVDSDGTFGDDVARSVFGNLHAEPPAIAFALQFGDAADGVDMAEDEVAAEFFPGGEWRFEVNECAGS